MYTHEITYQKTFITGLLKGMTVCGGFKTVEDLVEDYHLDLKDMTEDNPGIEAITGNKYYVKNISIREL